MVDDGAQPTRRIGDVPEGAPLQCRLDRHVGRKDGGLLAFTCERCGGEFWQTERLHHALTHAATLAVGGRHAEASVVVDAALQDMRRPRPPAEPRRRAVATRPGCRGAPPDRVHLRRSRPRA